MAGGRTPELGGIGAAQALSSIMSGSSIRARRIGFGLGNIQRLHLFGCAPHFLGSVDLALPKVGACLFELRAVPLPLHPSHASLEPGPASDKGRDHDSPEGPRQRDHASSSPALFQERAAGLRVKHDGTYNSGGYVRQGVTPTGDP